MFPCLCIPTCHMHNNYITYIVATQWSSIVTSLRYLEVEATFIQQRKADSEWKHQLVMMPTDLLTD